jgi:pre-mRNA-splicing helicase BRR2
VCSLSYLQTKLDFTVPSSPGQHSLTLYFMCDSWLGCDQEYEIELKVAEAMDAE